MSFIVIHSALTFNHCIPSSEGLESALTRMGDYKVQFEVFEGPLDLLLYLIKKDEVDIYEINITKITQEFIRYIEVMRRFDLEVAGEFLVMAATLMLIKSRELLPVEQRAHSEEEEDGTDPRWELIRRLVEYKKFKDTAGHLKEMEREQGLIYYRNPGKIKVKADPTPETEAPTVSIDSLIRAVSQVLKRFNDRSEDARNIFEDQWTISEKMEDILGELGETGRFLFQDFFERARTRVEVAVIFLAMLELIRVNRIRIVQKEPFGIIEVYRVSQDISTESSEDSGFVTDAVETAPVDS